MPIFFLHYSIFFIKAFFHVIIWSSLIACTGVWLFVRNTIKTHIKVRKEDITRLCTFFFLLWATSCCCSFFALIIKIKVKYIKRKDIPYNNPHSIHHGIILDFIVCCCVCARHIATMYRAKVMIIYMLYPSHISTKISSWGRKKNST